MKTNYLLVDYGNSFIKAATYNPSTHKIIEINQIAKGQSAQKLLSLFKAKALSKVFISATANCKFIKPFCLGLKKQLKSSIHFVNKKDFKGLLDFTNLSKGVQIGIDICLCSFAMSRMFKTASLIVCLGTAYFAILVKNKQLKSAYLLPSICQGLNQISRLTTIPDKDIPKTFKAVRGLNTHDSFAAGANLCIEGFVDNLVRTNKISSKNVIITGGDSTKYKNICNKYKTIQNFVLYALATLVKQKHW